MSYILVAEDETPVLDVILATLEALGHEIEHVGNGQEALVRCLARKPDLLITDDTMPVMIGRELIRRLRANKDTATTKTILLTAQAEALRDVSHGADILLGKPFLPSVLKEKINQLLGQ